MQNLSKVFQWRYFRWCQSWDTTEWEANRNICLCSYCITITKIRQRVGHVVDECHLGQVKSVFISVFTYQACSSGTSSMESEDRTTFDMSHVDPFFTLTLYWENAMFFHWKILCSLQNKFCGLSLYLLKQTKIAALFYLKARDTMWFYKSRWWNELGSIFHSSNGTAVHRFLMDQGLSGGAEHNTINGLEIPSFHPSQ